VSVGNGIGAAIIDKLLGPPGVVKPTKRILFGKNCIGTSFLSIPKINFKRVSKKNWILWHKIWSKLKITLTEMRYLTTNYGVKIQNQFKRQFWRNL
jgi:hypothetical protein